MKGEKIMLVSLLRKAPSEVRRKLQNRNTEITFEDIQERRIQAMNEVKGNLTGYDCPICKNKGVIHYLKDGYEFAKPCECMKLRDSLRRIRQSGLGDLLNEYTFDKFQTESPWQEAVKNSALKFLEDHDRKWFFIGGQVGAGKTHLCTAMGGEFFKGGNRAK